MKLHFEIVYKSKNLGIVHIEAYLLDEQNQVRFVSLLHSGGKGFITNKLLLRFTPFDPGHINVNGRYSSVNLQYISTGPKNIIALVLAEVILNRKDVTSINYQWKN